MADNWIAMPRYKLHKRLIERILSADARSHDDLSKMSGIRRNAGVFNGMVSNDSLLAPFYALQNLFLEKGLSSSDLIPAEQSS